MCDEASWVDDGCSKTKRRDVSVFKEMRQFETRQQSQSMSCTAISRRSRSIPGYLTDSYNRGTRPLADTSANCPCGAASLAVSLRLEPIPPDATPLLRSDRRHVNMRIDYASIHTP